MFFGLAHAPLARIAAHSRPASNGRLHESADEHRVESVVNAIGLDVDTVIGQPPSEDPRSDARTVSLISRACRPNSPGRVARGPIDPRIRCCARRSDYEQIPRCTRPRNVYRAHIDGHGAMAIAPRVPDR